MNLRKREEILKKKCLRTVIGAVCFDRMRNYIVGERDTETGVGY